MRKDDPGVGTLGLNIRMGDTDISIAQKKAEPFSEGPPGETEAEKIQRGRAILREARADDPGSGNLGLNIHMDGENYSIAQKSVSEGPPYESEADRTWR